MHDTMEARCAQIYQHLQYQSSTLFTQMIENLYRFSMDLNRIETLVDGVKQDVCDNRADISELQRTTCITSTQLERLEKEVGRLDENSRQLNLKFHGVSEGRSGESENDIDELVELLNDCSNSRSWDRRDISGSYCLGTPNRRSGDQPRPLIVTFCRSVDRTSILRDRDLCEQLRRRGVRVGADLTVRQRETIKWYKDQGKIAYYWNGRLQVQDGNPPRHHSRHNEINTKRHDIREGRVHHQNLSTFRSRTGSNNQSSSRYQQNNEHQKQSTRNQKEILADSSPFCYEHDYETWVRNSNNWDSEVIWTSEYRDSEQDDWVYPNTETLDVGGTPFVSQTSEVRDKDIDLPHTPSRASPSPASDVGTDDSAPESVSCLFVPLEGEIDQRSTTPSREDVPCPNKGNLLSQASPLTQEGILPSAGTYSQPQPPSLSQEDGRVPHSQPAEFLPSPAVNSAICK
ncbi:hypothetical protein ACOMHN_044393 [Nucella lapillus]